jgi:8-oxo-dGTP pyrophosphatase MutT (NUDIX family)
MKDKAGIIPYHRADSGKIVFAFMVSSDPRFGGAAPQIAKGELEHGESPKEGAIREAEEELGLRQSNMLEDTFRQAWTGGLVSEREFHVFVVEVKSPADFNKPHFETEAVVWLSAGEFDIIGRPSHRHIVALAAKMADTSG